jgi:hypothetical protein
MKLITALILTLIVLIFPLGKALCLDPITPDKIINDPAVENMGNNWYRIVIKENLSNTKYDWRFDLRKIETQNGHVVISHRMEQNSGCHPSSNWVIEYIFIDYNSDGILDRFMIDRFISVSDGDGWYKIHPRWPDNFNYPQDLLSDEKQKELFEKELEYWNYKLN